MKINMKKIMTGFLSVLLLTGCASQTSASASEGNASKSLQELYPDLPEENNYYFIQKEDLQSYMEHGTGLLFFGFPECPWCQSYMPMLQKVLEEADLQCAYYNIYTDKSGDREFYDQIADLLVSQNDTGEEIIYYSSDGKQVIYMPLVLFIDEGRIVFYDDETCTEDSSVITPEEYWTEEKMTALYDRLLPAAQKIGEKLTELESRGCDQGCVVGGK